MATRISQQQLNKFISPEAAMAPYERAQQDKTQRNAQDAALAQLIKGKEMDAQAKNDMYSRQLETAEGLRGKYGSDVNIDAGDIKIGGRDPLQALLRKKTLEEGTPGQKAADVAFGKEYSDFVAGGGSEGAKKNINALDTVAAQLKARGGEKPNLIQRGIQFLPDAARAALTPEIKAQEDMVRGAIQGSLRQTLGAQFTEKEGEQLMRRSYDPRLSAEQNLAKIKPELEALKAQLQRKMGSAQQFERTGSIRGINAAGGAPAPAPQQAPTAGGVSSMSDEELTALYNQLKGGK